MSITSVTNETTDWTPPVHFPDEEARSVYAVAIPVMITCCAIAIVLNTMVLLTIRLLRHPANPTLKLTYSLAAADIWTSLVIAGGLISHSYLPTAIHWEKAAWQDCASYALEALRLGGILTSVLHLLALACNHYSAIAYPMKYKCWTHRNGYWVDISVFMLWIAPPVLYFVVFAAYSNKTFAPTVNDCNPDFLGTLGFRVLVFFTIFIPLVVLSVVYLKIAVLLKKLQNQLVFTRNETLELTSPGLTMGACQQNRRYSFVQRKTTVVMTALLIVATSLLGWLPAVLFFVITCSVCVYPYTSLHSFPWILFSLTISVNALMILKGLLNPFIYAVRIPEIKDAIVTFFDQHGIHSRQRSSSGRDEDGERRNGYPL